MSRVIVTCEAFCFHRAMSETTAFAGLLAAIASNANGIKRLRERKRALSIKRT